MIECAECKKSIPDDSAFCPYCGKPTPSCDVYKFVPVKKKILSISILCLLLALVATAILALILFYNSKRTEDIAFYKDVYSLSCGEDLHLDVKFTPSNAKNQEYTFITSEIENLEIDNNTHKVTAKKPGKAYVTIVQNDIEYGKCLIEIADIEPEEISLDAEEPLTVEIGRTSEIPFQYTPSNTTDQNFKIEISNPEVAVSTDNTLKGLAKGKAHVVATHKVTGLTVEFDIKVVPVELETIKVDIPSSLEIGSTVPLKAGFYPQDVTDKELKWSSSSSCAKIEDGKLIGVKKGKATITAKSASGVTDSIEINVVPVEVKSLSIVSNTLTIKKDDKYKATYTLTPGNATDQTVKWSSSNTNVVKVDKDGNITAINPGSAVITAEASNGIKDHMSVTVNPKPLEIKNGWVVKTSASCQCPMAIHAPYEKSVYVYFKERKDSARDFGVLVKAGTTYEFDAPTGKYTVYYASGDVWYGKGYDFGDNTTYAQCDTIFENYVDGYEACGHEITLYAVNNGNMKTENISATQFPG